MSLNQPDIKELKAIVDWVNVTEGIRELSLRYGDVELFVSRNQQSAPSQVVPAVATPVAPLDLAALAPVAAPAALAVHAPAALAPAPAASAGSAENEVVVKAPMVGIFYAAPKPGAPAFVEEGARVEVGSVLCIVEVMKLMNNVEATVGGTIKRILIANNDAVSYGQPIMVIEPDA